jgi:hypothetical protein
VYYTVKKKLISAWLLCCLCFPAFSQVDVDVQVRNQRFQSDTFFFDIYLQATGSENLFLGHSDFALNFNEAFFNEPKLNMVSGSSLLVNASGDPTPHYDANIGYDLKYVGVNAYRMMVYLNMPFYSSSAQFYERVARIDNVPMTHRIGTFYLTNAASLNTNPELSWKTAGKGLVLNVIHRDSASQEAQQANFAAIDPSFDPEPVVQAGNLTVTAKTNTGISLSWTAGSGTQRILLARRNDAPPVEFPEDGILYLDNSTFGLGSEIAGSGTYVVYKGAGTTATITGLDAATEYTFYILEMDGANGWSENYNTENVASITDVTDLNFMTANIKVFLQGPYNPATGLMNTHLRMGNSFGAANLIPAAQPYNAAPWSYTGTEQLDTALHPDNLVDWVLLELRAEYNGSPVARRAAFLLSNGNIVDIDGSPVEFEGLSSGNYYIVIKHRNHLAVMSRESIPFSSGSPASYDFTNAGQSGAYGNDTTNFQNLPLSNVGSGFYAMRAGDAGGNAANQIRYNGGGQNDRVSLLNFVGGASSSSVPSNNQYSRNDINMDRQVRYNGGGQNDRVRLLNHVGGASSSSVPLNTPVPNP